MSHRKYDQLDFTSIKTNLKTFLQSQDTFKDYDFSGTTMSMLLDVLAYNTAYNGFYLNMLSSEMFLDSATMPESVASIAKHLGYVPRSVNSLRARISLTIVPNSSAGPVPDRLYITRDTPFSASVSGDKYLFIPEKSQYVDKNSSGNFVIPDIGLIEGTNLTHSYTVNNGLPIKQRFIIPNNMADLSTLLVKVKQSETNSTEEVYSLAGDISTLSPTQNVYFIQPYENGLYEVVFGDGVLGTALQNGNVVTLDYIVSSGSAATGAKNFVSAYSFGSYAQGRTTVVCTSPAKDFVEAESKESIKLLAPKAYTAQNRAVTKFDYEVLLKKDVPTIEHVRVWGGETNDPPVYGKVFCSIKPISGYELNADDKKRLIDNYIKPRSILSFDVELVDPDYIYMTIQTTVNFLGSKTLKQPADLKNIVTQGIKQFRTNNLSGFDADFRHSRMSGYIDSLDASIESNTTDVKIKYRLFPQLYTYFNKDILLSNEIDTGDASNNNSAISSTDFVYKGTLVKLADDGLGKLYLYYTLNNKRIVVNSDVGEVDYTNGKILLRNMFVDQIPNDQIYIDIFVMPKNNDIIAMRNQMLRLEDEDIYISVLDVSKARVS
jgi:hypothetical protein